ncbi:hypothetical protein [Janthinobacterium fluminis]|uniref:Uncharacterized protein n=1 Tax=Janthinobacterium fluminis TaxID=2987524 RepID=A0ABT5JXA2_9BURK|nr:hypothetical protein [Janthinobacterium fluminis]MDC8756162.1 hypothetical protein [Janthinobacterium fluminis]
MDKRDAGGGPAGAWFNPPAEFPGICMTLAPGGELRFAGGFTFYHPSRWSYDSARSELRIELGGTIASPAESANYQLEHHQGNLLRVEAAKRALVYRVTASTESIQLGGFVFYRNLACETGKAAQR